VQGSGKSHTVSVLLESMLIPDCSHIGSLFRPLSGLVLHFGEGGASSRPSEASWVAVPSIPDVQTPRVRVYVSRSSLNTMRKVYETLGDRVTVSPLVFDQAELDAAAFLSMMSVGSSDSAPLYIQIVLVSTAANMTDTIFIDVYSQSYANLVKTSHSKLSRGGWKSGRAISIRRRSLDSSNGCPCWTPSWPENQKDSQSHQVHDSEWAN
jgi:hypothetical protein